MPASVCSSTGWTSPPRAAIHSITGELRPPPTTTRSASTWLPSSSRRPRTSVPSATSPSTPTPRRHVTPGSAVTTRRSTHSIVSRRQHHSTSSSSPGRGARSSMPGGRIRSTVSSVAPCSASMSSTSGARSLSVRRSRASSAWDWRACGAPRRSHFSNASSAVVGQVGVVALVHRDPVAVASEEQSGEHAGHPTADDGDVLGVGDRFEVRAHRTLPEEVDQRLVDLVGPLLLGPVAAPLEDQRSVQLRQRRLERGDGRRPPDRGTVAVTADEQRRHVDRLPAERGEILPVAVDVAVPVERTAKAGVLELARVHIEIDLGQPVGHRVGVVEAILHLGAVGDRRHGALRRVGRRGVSRGGVHEAAQPPAHVGLDLGLGPPRLLEVLDVELLVAGHRPHRGERPISDGGEYGTERPATAVNTSGRSRAEVQAIGAPQSWPTITACSSPSAATSPTLSATRRTIR